MCWELGGITCKGIGRQDKVKTRELCKQYLHILDEVWEANALFARKFIIIQMTFNEGTAFISYR